MTRNTSLRTLAQRWLSALVLSLALVTVASAQETIRITGRVVSKSDKEPLIGVNITDAHVKRAYAATDVDGRFAFNVHLGTTLKFSMVGAKSVNVKVKNHKFMEVEMEEENISLGEVVVAAKIIKDKFANSKNIVFADTTVKILSALNAENLAQIEALADEMLK